MSFEHPWWLAIGTVLGIGVALGYVLAERRMTSRDLAYSDLAFFESAVSARAWITHALRGVWIAALACIVLSASGPKLTIPTVVKDGSVFICIDTSGSMQSTDVQPTRAQAAKEAARAFIDQASSGTKIGIIAFASGASVIQPLTADHDQVKSALDAIPEPNGATAIGDALRLAAEGLPPAGHRVVVLVTDGVNNAGSDPQEAAQYLGAHHIPVYTIGIGTPNGDLIGGEQATIDESALESYADASGGAYARAENATQLRDALARLGSVTAFERKPVDTSLGFAFAAAILFGTALFTGLATGRVP
jgi:Ca-activated chloride channel homolog